MHAQHTPEPRYGWVMAALAPVFMGLGAGTLVSIAAFLVPISESFAWSRGHTALGYMVGSIAMGAGGIVMGYLADRWSTRRVVLLGALGLGGALLLLGRLGSLWEFYAFYCLLGGLGSAALDVPLMTNVGNWFSRNKGLAVGIATAGRSLGQGGVPYLAGALIAAYGWREAYTVLGLAALVLLLPLALLIRQPPAPPTPLAGTPAAEAGAGARPLVLVAWLSALVVFCCALMATPMVHLVAVAQEQGLTAQQAANVLLLIYLAGFVGRIAFGKLADRIGALRSYLVASAAQTALVFAFVQVSGVAAYYGLAVLFGLGFSGVMTTVIVTVREMAPAARRGLAMGVVLFFAWIGMGLGGWQAGFLYDLTGGYTVAFAAAALTGVVNLAGLVGLVLHVRRARTPAAMHLWTNPLPLPAVHSARRARAAMGAPASAETDDAA